MHIYSCTIYYTYAWVILYVYYYTTVCIIVITHSYVYNIYVQFPRE